MGSKSRKALTIVIILGFLTTAGAAGGTWYFMDQQSQKQKAETEQDKKNLEEQKKELEGKIKKSEDETAKETADDSKVKYTNSQYGFELTFPDDWKNYGLTETYQDGVTKIIYFGLPKKTPSKELPTDFDKGYSNIFAIGVYTKNEWTEAQKLEGPKEPKIGESSKYVFSYSHGNGVPEPVAGISTEQLYKDADSISKTFKKGCPPLYINNRQEQ